MEYPTYADIVTARAVVSRYLPRTPVYRYPGLSALAGCELFVKHENHLPIGAFKVRGGVNFMASLPPADKQRGVITATRGNHGLSVAYAARLFGTKAVLVVPRGNNPEKNAGMAALGAEVVEYGKDFDEAREQVDKFLDQAYLAGRARLRIIHGHGKGILRKSLHEMFASHPHVEKFYPAAPNEGGAGATIVELKV